MTINTEGSCTAISEVLARIGDKWSTLVIANLGNGTLRFGELRRAVDGISQRMLTVTLRNLERDGLLTRRVFAEIPPRVEYTLTDLGQSLLHTIEQLVRWSTVHAIDIEHARQNHDRSQIEARPETLGTAPLARSANP